VPIVAFAFLLAIGARASAQPQPLSAFHTDIPLGSDPAAALENSQAHAASQASPAAGVWRDLFAPLPSDFRGLLSWPNALILGIGGSASLAVHPSDAHVAGSVLEAQTLEEVLDPGSPIGSGYTQFAAALTTYIVGRASHRVRVAQAGSDLVRAQAVNLVLTQGVKMAVQRVRPDGNRWSFPSGHASSAFATATVLQQYCGWRLGIPAYAMASYVAGSRVTENRHYVSDVVFGATIGIIAGRTVTIGHGGQRFAVAPIAADRGIGVGLIHVPMP